MQLASSKLRNELANNSPISIGVPLDLSQPNIFNLQQQQGMDDTLAQDVRSQLNTMKSFRDDLFFMADGLPASGFPNHYMSPYIPINGDQNDIYLGTNNYAYRFDDNTNSGVVTANNRINPTDFPKPGSQHREHLLSVLAHKNIEKYQKQMRLQQQHQQHQHQQHLQKNFPNQHFQDRRMINQPLPHQIHQNNTFSMHQGR
ncbi:uncharacterized protein NDAI_0A08520 [Naumovozyma dairenensis CBS 421]|uniref:Uncharacterized protein n=1 Tax=Naumovozyma dairenensis (strain ATCC 10597 / BCRC 20456 / CBS 421 / NBRC 0211 / NRRL Y-12639) TaxID=1071378 RepID=G0W5B7_NAUDC|nr:hypothetical protein NDAI_0A08520 [Naumovozyma dairenensis CBS 421]CCD23005.1 hypothetical protein NDAI_0A08520 [Naumovozyma dairenensis CBS 421]